MATEVATPVTGITTGHAGRTQSDKLKPTTALKRPFPGGIRVFGRTVRPRRRAAFHAAAASPRIVRSTDDHRRVEPVVSYISMSLSST